MDLIEEIGHSFSGIPDDLYRLRWEIYINSVLYSFNSWSPLSVKKFSEERKNVPNNAEIFISKLDNKGDKEAEKMLKILNKDIVRMEYSHLLVASKRNFFAGIILHTLFGKFFCCVNGEVFEEK